MNNSNNNNRNPTKLHHEIIDTLLITLKQDNT